MPTHGSGPMRFGYSFIAVDFHHLLFAVCSGAPFFLIFQAV